MSRLKLFSRRDKAAMKKAREETTPSVIPKLDCPYCGAGWVKGNYCYDCGSALTPPQK